MPTTKAFAISPTVVCANGDFRRLEKLLITQITQNKTNRLFIPIAPELVKLAKEGKLSKNAQIARMQRIVQVAISKGVRVSSAYDTHAKAMGEKLLNQKPKGSKRTFFEMEHDIALGDYSSVNESNKKLQLLNSKKAYFEKLSAIDGGLRKAIKSNPDERTMIITRPFFAAHVMEMLKVPAKKYQGITPHGKVPAKPDIIKAAELYLKHLKKQQRSKPAPKLRSRPIQKGRSNTNSRRTIPLNRRHGKR
jgi:hypothetical protein